jgi:hypothetical protein
MKLVATTDVGAPADQNESQQIVCKIRFAAALARPDVSCVFPRLAQFSVNPSSKHLRAAKRVLGYPKGTTDTDAAYHPLARESMALSNVDWTADQHSPHSQYDIVLIRDNGTIS